MTPEDFLGLALELVPDNKETRAKIESMDSDSLGAWARSMHDALHNRAQAFESFMAAYQANR